MMEGARGNIASRRWQTLLDDRSDGCGDETMSGLVHVLEVEEDRLLERIEETAEDRGPFFPVLR
jgi:hypothetical protein